MSEFQPALPENTQLLSNILDGQTSVPNTEERKHIRISDRVYNALAIASNNCEKSLTHTASVGMYFGRRHIGRTYNIQWEAWREWYMERLENQSSKYSSLYGDPPSLQFEAQGQLSRYVYVVPKHRKHEWWNDLKQFCGVSEENDVYRLALYFGLLFYDWQTHAGLDWDRWLDGVRQCVWEFEQVVQDRQMRIEKR